MKYIKLLSLSAALCATLISCGNFGDLNKDPNNPATPMAAYMFTRAEQYARSFVFSGTFNPLEQMLPGYIAERQNVQYGDFSLPNYSTADYYRYALNILKQIIDLNTDEETKSQSNVLGFGSNTNQLAAARTLRAFIYMHLTDVLGMIVYSEALQGSEGNFTPKFDTQEFIYTDLDKELKEAYEQFDTSSKLTASADLYFAGDMTKWQKLNTTLRMLMAIKLADVDPASGRARFAEAYAQNKGMTTVADGMIYKYLPESANEHPLYTNIVRDGRKDFAPNKVIVDVMNGLDDPRRAVYFTENAEGEYVGIPLGISQADVGKYNLNNSEFAPAFYAQDAPMRIITAPRVLLVQAEAAVRGWISDDAAALYKAGIQASFDDYNVTADVDAYMNQDSVRFEGTVANKLKVIAFQRHIAGYMQDGIEAWSDWRRFNVPTITVGPAVLNHTHVPYRLEYNSSDINKIPNEYIDEIIQLQGPNSCDTRVWWDVADNP